MAGTITYEFGGGVFVVDVHFNDLLRVDRLTATNTSGGAGDMTFTRPDTGTARPAHQLTSPVNSGALFVVVPTTVQQRIQLVERSPGKFDGLEGFISWEGSPAAAVLSTDYAPVRARVTADDGLVRVRRED